MDMLGQMDQSGTRTTCWVSDLSESRADDETDQSVFLDRSGVRSGLEEGQQVDGEDVSRLSICGTEVEQSV